MTGPELVLGPLLRHTSATTATVWVEVSSPARVQVAGHEAQTVAVDGAHYALVVVEGLAPGSAVPYDVRLDGRRVWPQDDDPRPAPLLRTLPAAGAVSVAFGSCRVGSPDEPPWTDEPGTHPDAVGVDALVALSLALQAGEVEVPDLLLLLGDQVYVDAHLPPDLLARQAARRGDSAPQGQVADLEELRWLYRDTWSRPEVRWLLATVPTAMVWDDHEVADGFGSSAAWEDEHRAEPWWPDRVRGAYAAYWLYQHLGNLAPDEARAALERVRADGGAALLRLADGPPAALGHVRDLGAARLVVLDDRGGRVLREQDRRVMGEPDWAAAEAQLTGGTRHLLVAASLPVLLQPAVAGLERAGDAVLRGVWGRRAARRALSLRHGKGLDHWDAFPRDRARLLDRLLQVAAGRVGAAPSTVVLLSGDVHYSYVARLRLPHGVRAPVVQVVSSPLRNGLPRLLRAGFRLAETPVGRLAGRLLARAAGERPPDDTRLTTGPLYGNGLGVLRLDGAAATLVLHRAVLRDGRPALVVRHEERLDTS